MKFFYSLPMYYGASPALFQLAKQMRTVPTEAESKLWELLEDNQFRPHKFRRQHPISRYIADFYSHSLKLVIEADGGIHEREERKYYDQFRDEDMLQLGIKVLRFKNQEILEGLEMVKQKINAVIQRTEAGC